MLSLPILAKTEEAPIGASRGELDCVLHVDLVRGRRRWRGGFLLFLEDDLDQKGLGAARPFVVRAVVHVGLPLERLAFGRSVFPVAGNNTNNSVVGASV